MSRKDTSRSPAPDCPSTSGPPREPASRSRRNFLRAAGVVGLGAAAAPLATGEAEARESPDEQIKARYQLSEHVQRFYFLNSL